MKCPACKSPDLVMSERQGVEIDYCPECRGVWLDRGELDKILERSERELSGGPRAPATPQPAPYPHQPSRNPHDSDVYPAQGYKKRKHWLSELLD
jgi:Zn-finger nucleic acid-binding protein